MSWSPMTTEETVHGSEVERFSSEEPGNGAALAEVACLPVVTEVEAQTKARES